MSMKQTASEEDDRHTLKARRRWIYFALLISVVLSLLIANWAMVRY